MVDDIDRVKSLTIDGFRGFVTRQELNTDADIILVVGANGHGKSSLLEALQLVVAGAALPKRHVEALPARQRDAHGREIDGTSFLIEAICAGATAQGTAHWRRAVRATSTADGALSLTIQSGGEEPMAFDAWSAEAKLQARLAAFFQDDVDLLFDQAANGRTLLDVVSPPPALLLAVAEELAERAGACRNDANQAAPPGDDAVRELDQRDFAAWQGARALRDILTAAAPLYPAWPPLPTHDTALGWRDAIAELALAAGRDLDRGANLPTEAKSWLVNALPGWLKDATEKARRSRDQAALRALEAEQADLEAALAQLDRDFPRLEADLRAFSGTGAAGGVPALADVLAALDELRDEWLAAARRRAPVFDELARELEAIDGGKLGAQRRSLVAWLDKRRRADVRGQQLRQRLGVVTRQLQAATPDTDLLRALRGAEAALDGLSDIGPWQRAHRWLLYDEDRRRRALQNRHWTHLADRLDDMAAGVRDANNAAPACLTVLAEALNQVAGRFKLGAGALPLVLTHEFIDDDPASSVPSRRLAKIAFGDGRDLNHFSTGQRSQAAVSFMVAQNLLVRNSYTEVASRLAHRVLILDDVATSYDLSNLVVETLLWRQLAYTDKTHLKRQIFIASHHDDLSNQLIDLLQPPPPYQMRVLRFTDWDPHAGPTIRQQRVGSTSPTPKAADQSHAADLQTALNELFEGDAS